MASGSEEEPIEETYANLPAAMNQSIYLMLIVPYSSLLIVGFLIYRGMKKNREYLEARAAEEGAEPTTEG